jgi:hypothetical protein
VGGQFGRQDIGFVHGIIELVFAARFPGDEPKVFAPVLDELLEGCEIV